MNKDIEEFWDSISGALIIWAVMAIIPGLGFLDIIIVPVLSIALHLTLLTTWTIYHIIAIVTLLVLAPKKLKKMYTTVRKWFA